MNVHARDFAPTDEPTYREVPNNIEAEQALLGAMLVNNEAFFAVAEFLATDHFFEPLHREIFAKTSEMIRMGKIANPVTIKTFLAANDRVGDITVAQYLARLAAEATTIINAGDYGRAIYDLAIRRNLIRIGEDMVNVAFDAPLDAEPRTQIEAAEEALSSLRMPADANGQDGDDITASMDGLMRRMSEPKAAERTSIPVPLSEIADILHEPGLTPGNLYGLLGASGEGKTSLMLQFAWAACESGHPTLILTFDQSKDQIIRQMWSQASGISVPQMMQHNPGGRETLRQGDWRAFGRRPRPNARLQPHHPPPVEHARQRHHRDGETLGRRHAQEVRETRTDDAGAADYPGSRQRRHAGGSEGR